MGLPGSTGRFWRARHEQLALYLRTAIECGELTEPLPSTRLWSRQLAVSRNTLDRALAILARQGLLEIRPRQPLRLRARHGRAGLRARPVTRVVRWVYPQAEYPDQTLMIGLIPALADRLHAQDVAFTVEPTSAARLEQLSGRGPRANELLILASLPPHQQRRFNGWARQALLIGTPAEGVVLSYLNVDDAGASRHAAHTLLRQGFSQILLLLGPPGIAGTQRKVAAFEQAIAAWPHQPVGGQAVPLFFDWPRLLPALERLAKRITPAHGIVVVEPVPSAAVMTAVLSAGHPRPAPGWMYVVSATPASIRLCPPPPHYPFPVRAMVNVLTKTALEYFEAGAVPRLARTLPMELVRPGSV